MQQQDAAISKKISTPAADEAARLQPYRLRSLDMDILSYVKLNLVFESLLLDLGILVANRSIQVPDPFETHS